MQVRVLVALYLVSSNFDLLLNLVFVFNISIGIIYNVVLVILILLCVQGASVFTTVCVHLDGLNAEHKF